MKERSQGIVKGALFLTVAGLLVKVLGMIYKIPLTNRLGDDGMGYFNAAYTIYTLFFVLSSSGLPTALSLSVSKDLATDGEARAGERYAVTARFSAWLGFSLFLMLLLLAKPLSYLVGSPNAYLAMVTVAPALWFVTASSSERGYHQGRGNMLSTALSQLIEALGKLVFGLILIHIAVVRGFSKDIMAAYAILGLSFASFLTYLVLKLCFRPKRQGVRYTAAERRALLLDTVKTALPITASALAATLASSLDLALLMRALQSIGYTPDAANAAWGNYSSMVLPLFHMPQVLLTPIAYASLPALRAAIAKNERGRAESLVKSALTVTALIASLAALGLSLFARDALSLVYTDEAAIAHAYPHLALVAIAVFPFGLMTVSASLLHAYGRLWLPTLSLALGAIVKALVTVFGVGVLGESVSAFGTLLAYTLSAAINFGVLSRASASIPLSRLVPKPFLTASLAVLGGLFLRVFCHARAVDGRIATLLSIAFAALLALGITMILKTLEKDDLAALGVGKEYNTE